MSEPTPLPLTDAAPKSALDELTSGSAGTLILLVLVFICYAWSSQSGYVWDDDSYVTGNTTLRSFAGLSRIWTELGATPQYYPMTFTSFWLETQLFGLKPQVSHVVNALLHAGSVLLLWKLLRRLNVPGAWAAAAVFAVHPICVESVAWISERKNTLSLILALSAAWLYVRFAGLGDKDEAVNEAAAPAGEGLGVALPDEPKRLYRLFLALFTLALLAKTTVAVLPAILVVLIWWKRGRVARADLLPLLPAFALGAVGGAVTSYLEHSPYYVGATGVEWDITLPQRVMLWGQTAVFYAFKIVYPFQIALKPDAAIGGWWWFPISFNYRRWTLDTGSPAQWLPLVGVLATLVALVVLRRRIGRGPLAAAAVFLLGLLPASGLFTFFPMRFSWVADHFAYVGAIGLIVGVVAALTVAMRRVPVAGAVVTGLVLLAMMPVTFWHALAFKDLKTLWERTLSQNPNSWLAAVGYGAIAMDNANFNAIEIARNGDDAEGNAARARDELRRRAELWLRVALKVNPNAYEAYRTLGALAAQRGDLDGALANYRKSQALAAEMRADGYRWPAFYIGDLLIRQGKIDEGLAVFTELEQLEPKLRGRSGSMFAQIRTRHGDVLRQSIKGPLKPEMSQADRDTLEAVIQQYSAAVEVGPDYLPPKLKLAKILIDTNYQADALQQLGDVLKLDPRNAEAKLLTARVAEKQGIYDAAAAQLANLLTLYPNYLPAQIELGRVLKAMGRTKDAETIVREAVERYPDSDEARAMLFDITGVPTTRAATRPATGPATTQAD